MSAGRSRTSPSPIGRSSCAARSTRSAACAAGSHRASGISSPARRTGPPDHRIAPLIVAGRQALRGPADLHRHDAHLHPAAGAGGGPGKPGDHDRGTAIGERGTGDHQRGTAVNQRGTRNHQRGTPIHQRGIGDHQRGAALRQRGAGDDERGAAAALGRIRAYRQHSGRYCAASMPASWWSIPTEGAFLESLERERLGTARGGSDRPGVRHTRYRASGAEIEPALRQAVKHAASEKPCSMRWIAAAANEVPHQSRLSTTTAAHKVR